MHSLLVSMLVAALPMGAAETRPRMAVLGFGSCESALLQTATREMRSAIATGNPRSVLDEDATAAPGGKLPRGSLEEVRRQVEAAKREFLNLDVPRSEKLFATALDAIDGLPLGPQRWELWVGAKVNFARMLQYAGREEDAIRQFLEILWLKEDFELNRSEFPPSTRELLERTRVLLKAQPRHELAVESKPSGATVYLNGYAVGRTPFRRAVPQGFYNVVVGEGGQFSFSRRISVSAPRTAEVDLGPEGRFRPTLGPCVQLDSGSAPDSDRALRLTLASLMASALDVDQVVAVRLTREGGKDGEQYVAAALVDRAGREVREGREEIRGERLPPLKRLSSFVLTGEQGAGLALSVDATEGTTPFLGTGAQKWTRVVGIALGGAAVLLAAGAVVSHVQAVSHHDDYNALVIPNGGGAIRPQDAEKANRLLREEIPAAERRRMLFGIGAGVLTLGSGVVLGVSFIDFGPPADDGGGSGIAVSVSGAF